MKIAVIQSSYEQSNSVFKDFDPYCDPSQYLPGNEIDLYYIVKSTAEAQIMELAKKNYDVIINLCDGGADEDRAGLEVVEVLEREGLPFTGASSSFYQPSKEHMKRVAQQAGIKTPAWVFAFKEEDIEAATKLNYPLIVKHYDGSGSIGTSKKSKVTNRDELYEQARKMIAQFHGALIEEFIEGREYTVLVAENPADETDPIAFLPVECVFTGGEEFKHFDIKWINYTAMKWVPCTDEVLSEKMKTLSKKIFVALGGVSYGRTDLRVNKAGEPYFLEINPQPGIFSAPNEEGCAADFILFNDPLGHKGFLKHIIDVAIQKAKRGKLKARQAGTA